MKIVTLLNGRIAKLKVINSFKVTKKLPVYTFHHIFKVSVKRQCFYLLRHVFDCNFNEQHVSMLINKMDGVCVSKREREREMR